MKKVLRLALVLALFGLIGSTFNSTAQAVTVPAEKTLWTQHFSSKAGTKVDPKFWSYDLGNGMGWGNLEQQYYTNKTANIAMDGRGRLVINAIKLNPEDPKDQYITNWCIDCKYSSAKIVTRGKLGFKYGSISARIQTPAGTGMWPAFWMLGVPRSTCDGWPSCGEIDIIEARGSQPYHSVASLHGPDYSGGNALSDYYFSGNTPLTAGFHIYRVDWLQNSIKFYVDGNLVGSHTKSSIAPNSWVFNAEFYLILNLATGGNFDGGALDETIQQASLKVDWIKYTTHKGKGTLIRHN
ncbi:MAG: glycoside hydrolase family 16 protein [Actinobacteria bacterium]|nr:glycoside hydrolase family 16 protein [Actinomycetota bacterium]